MLNNTVIDEERMISIDPMDNRLTILLEEDTRYTYSVSVINSIGASRMSPKEICKLTSSSSK